MTLEKFLPFLHLNTHSLLLQTLWTELWKAAGSNKIILFFSLSKLNYIRFIGNRFPSKTSFDTAEARIK